MTEQEARIALWNAIYEHHEPSPGPGLGPDTMLEQAINAFAKAVREDERRKVAELEVLAELEAERDAARIKHESALKTIETLRLELTNAQRNNHKRNLELDALHYVWCDGGCEGGTHRWDGGKVTEEIVQAAERNTRRLRRWFASRQRRDAVDKKQFARSE